MKRHVLTYAGFFLLSGCATAMDGSSQQLRVETVGATNAKCLLTEGNDKLEYVALPPQTIWVKRSGLPLHIECIAPGNRVKTADVSPHGNMTTAANLANGSLGVPYDLASGARYEYPSTVVVDFTGIPVRPDSLPSYENTDNYKPSDSSIEYLGPDVPKQAGDDALALRRKIAIAESEQEEAAAAAQAQEKQNRINALDGGFYGDKGNKTAPLSPLDTPPAKTNAAPPVPLKSESGTKFTAPGTGSNASGSSGLNVPNDTKKQLPQPIFPSTTSF